MHIEGCKIPNNTHPEVPIGDESKATTLQIVGKPPTFSFTPKDHVELGIFLLFSLCNFLFTCFIGTNLGILDLEVASKVSGRKFYYLMRDGALLEMALVNWAMQKLTSKGYTYSGKISNPRSTNA